MELSVVVPSYNEEGNVKALVERFSGALMGLDAELVLVDNGSTDGTGRIIRELIGSGRFPFLQTTRVEVNQGYGYGIKQGLKKARGKFLCWTHADLQAEPGDAVVAYKAARESPNPKNVFVKGKRMGGRAGLDRVVTFGMGVFSSLCLRQSLSDINGQPKLFPREFLSELENSPDDFSLDLYAYWKARKSGMQVIEIPVGFGRRASGKSKWASNPASRIRTIAGTIGYIAGLGAKDLIRRA